MAAEQVVEQQDLLELSRIRPAARTIGVDRAEAEPEFREHEPTNSRRRRYLEWHTAHAVTSHALRLLMRTALLYVDDRVTRACHAHVATLAARASMTRRTVEALICHGRREGFVRGRAGDLHILMPTDSDVMADLRRLWATRHHLWKRYWHGQGQARDYAVLRHRWPDVFLPQEYADTGFTEAYVDQLIEAEVAQRVSRFDWIRTVTTWPAFAGAAGRVIKATAFAVELFMDSAGRPFRWTTRAELTARAGYRKGRIVQAALRALEQAQFLRIERRHGRTGGLLVVLDAPAAVRATWAVVDAETELLSAGNNYTPPDAPDVQTGPFTAYKPVLSLPTPEPQ
jgi:hypothetical protein